MPVTVPAAMFIESAKDLLDDASVITPDERADQLHELNFALGQQSADFARGYELGLQTARFMLLGNLKAREAGVTL